MACVYSSLSAVGQAKVELPSSASSLSDGNSSLLDEGGCTS